MTPAGTGRFCNACDKVVTDFTAMSDGELMSFFAKRAAGEHPCGRFRQDQLNKTIAEHTASKRSRLFNMAASLLLMHTFLYQGKASGKTPQQIEILNQSENADTGNLKITGFVLDYHSNKPINGLKVYIDSTAHHAITDKKGKFSIVIPETLTGKITLLTEYINNRNYVAASIILAKEGNVEELSSSALTLFRYPEETLNEVQVLYYRVPIIISGAYSMGAPATVVRDEKETFWHRITKVFRRK